MTNSLATKWLDNTRAVMDRIEQTQTENIRRAAEVMADSIAAGRWVHTFGCGHATIPVEEMYPRIGGFVGFHPMVELPMTFFTRIVGEMGVHQFLFLERAEGYGVAIMKGHEFDSRDCMWIFSHSGINNVNIDVALRGQEARHEGHCLRIGRGGEGQADAALLRQNDFRYRGYRGRFVCTSRGRVGAAQESFRQSRSGVDNGIYYLRVDDGLHGGRNIGRSRRETFYPPIAQRARRHDRPRATRCRTGRIQASHRGSVIEWHTQRLREGRGYSTLCLATPFEDSGRATRSWSSSQRNQPPLPGLILSGVPATNTPVIPHDSPIARLRSKLEVGQAFQSDRSPRRQAGKASPMAYLKFRVTVVD